MIKTSKKKQDLVLRILNTCSTFIGAFSMVVLSEKNVEVLRDPHRFRSLIIEKKHLDNYIVFASERSVSDWGSF